MVDAAAKKEESKAIPLSYPVEKLLSKTSSLHCDVLIIGSGYGGSIAAMTLAQSAGLNVWVMERGKEYGAGDFPESVGELPGHVRFQRSDDANAKGYPGALFDVRLYDGISVLLGNGLGGGSLINAGVVMRPHPGTFDNLVWPQSIRKVGKSFLSEEFGEIESLLGAAVYKKAESLEKYKALQRFAKSLKGAKCEPVPIAVSQKDGANSVGVSQKACIECGNCITGCNYEAKNTLTMNAIPLACSRGAEFYTGASALSIKKFEDAEQALHNGRPLQWTVQFARTATVKQENPDQFAVQAHIVILAAGALGSTELLLRSRQHLQISDRAGERFNGNGDFLAASFGQKRRVNAFSGVDIEPPPPGTGPTIVGVVKTGKKSGVLPPDSIIEDGAVPSALMPFMGALFSTLAIPQRFVKADLPAWFRKTKSKDFVAAPNGPLAHSQIFLGISAGVDPIDSPGKLALNQFGQIKTAKKISAPQSNKRIHEAIKKAEGSGGLDGGDYFPNPAWQILPDQFDGFASVAGGAQSITVHPLGGCAMGDSAASGVVDHWGNVFDASGGSDSVKTFPGLYVLDGAIVSAPLGVNPLLTISALALRAAREIARQVSLAKSPIDRVDDVYRLPWRIRQKPLPSESGPVSMQFTEWFHSSTALNFDETWQFHLGEKRRSAINKCHGLAAKIVLTVPDIWQWIARPESKWDATIWLYKNIATDAELLDEKHMDKPFASGKGEVALLELDLPDTLFGLVKRRVEVLKTFLERRRDLIPPITGEVLKGWIRNPLLLIEAISKLPKIVRGIYRWIVVHSHWRKLAYDFPKITLCVDSQQPALSFSLSGEKRLAYARNAKNLWTALGELDFSIKVNDPTVSSVEGSFAVDVIGMIRKRRLQVIQAPNTPVAIAALGAVGATFLRALLTTHLWTFRGTEYASLKVPESLRPIFGDDPVPAPARAITLRDGTVVEPELVCLFVPEREGSTERVEVQLNLYRKPDSPGKPLMFLHGQALSGESFTTPTVHCNMATYFVEKDYDVWVFDNRISSRLRATNDKPCSLDDIGKFDVPAAVRFIYDRYNKNKIDVFAHCIGAAVFEIAVLSGELQDSVNCNKSMVGRLALHAVHPWLIPSLRNRISGALGAFYRDLLDKPVAALVPTGAASFLDEITDRIASSIPWRTGEQSRHEHDREPGYGRLICNRMALFYGKQFIHENLDPRTHEAMHTLTGPTNFDVFRQIYFFTLRHRVTNKRGENEYLRSTLAKYWTFKTLFAHSLENDVFNPASALRSWRVLWEFFTHDVGLLLAPNTGHLDFLFGKNAHRDMPDTKDELDKKENWGCGIYEGLFLFFNDKPQHERTKEVVREKAQSFQHHIYAPTKPCVGPNFFYVLEGEDVLLKIWLEQSEYGSWDLAPPDAVSLPLSFVDMSDKWLGQGVKLPGQYWIATHRITRYRQITQKQSLDLDINMRFVDPVTGKVVSRGPWGVVPHVPAAVDFNDTSPQIKLNLSTHGWLLRLLDKTSPKRWSILAGSCRWPGTVFESDAVDNVFGAMLGQANDGDIDALWLLGDQIYADANANIMGIYQPNERYALRYRDAFSGDAMAQEFFSGRYLSELMRVLPTWMVVDDHEIDDDWSGIEPQSGANEMLIDAFSAALAYQWRAAPNDGNNPRFPHIGATTGVRGFWREFFVGDLPCFAMDTRFEREYRNYGNWRDAALISSEQFSGLSTWLTTCDRGLPKFILCGSPIGLLRKRDVECADACIAADDWSGYPATARRVLDLIAEENIPHVFFVSGDPHLSAWSKIYPKSRGRTIEVHSIILSGFNATLPFANDHEDECFWGGNVLPNLGDDVETHLLSDLPRQFGRIDVDCTARSPVVTVSVFNEKGERKEGKSFELQEIASDLEAM